MLDAKLVKRDSVSIREITIEIMIKYSGRGIVLVVPLQRYLHNLTSSIETSSIDVYDAKFTPKRCLPWLTGTRIVPNTMDVLETLGDGYSHSLIQGFDRMRNVPIG